MAYSPNNLTVYTAAMAGAEIGLAVSGRPITSDSGSTYLIASECAEAYAESFDTAWGATSSDTFQVFTILDASEGYFRNRGAKSIVPSDYTEIAFAIITAIGEGEAILASKGVTPAPWPSGGNSTLALFNLAAGGTRNVVGGDNEFIVYDGSTGVQGIVNLPANGISVDGQIVVVSILSSAPGSAPAMPNLQVNPGAGNQIENFNNDGQILATGTGFTATAQGACFGFRYRAAIVAPATTACWIRER